MTTKAFRDLLDELNVAPPDNAPSPVSEQVADLLEPIIYLAKTAAAIDWENVL